MSVDNFDIINSRIKIIYSNFLEIRKILITILDKYDNVLSLITETIERNDFYFMYYHITHTKIPAEFTEELLKITSIELLKLYLSQIKSKLKEELQINYCKLQCCAKNIEDKLCLFYKNSDNTIQYKLYDTINYTILFSVFNQFIGQTLNDILCYSSIDINGFIEYNPENKDTYSETEMKYYINTSINKIYYGLTNNGTIIAAQKIFNAVNYIKSVLMYYIFKYIQ